MSQNNGSVTHLNFHNPKLGSREIGSRSVESTISSIDNSKNPYGGIVSCQKTSGFVRVEDDISADNSDQKTTLFNLH